MCGGRGTGKQSYVANTLNATHGRSEWWGYWCRWRALVSVTTYGGGRHLAIHVRLYFIYSQLGVAGGGRKGYGEGPLRGHLTNGSWSEMNAWRMRMEMTLVWDYGCRWHVAGGKSNYGQTKTATGFENIQSVFLCKWFPYARNQK